MYYSLLSFLVFMVTICLSTNPSPLLGKRRTNNVKPPPVKKRKPTIRAGDIAINVRDNASAQNLVIHCDQHTTALAIKHRIAHVWHIAVNQQALYYAQDVASDEPANEISDDTIVQNFDDHNLVLFTLGLQHNILPQLDAEHQRRQSGISHNP